MKRVSSIFLIGICLVSWGLFSLQAQDQEQDLDQPPRNKVPTYQQNIAVNYMLVDVIVTDRKGNYIRNLSKEDFKLIENGRPQEIVSLDEYKMSTRQNVSTESMAAGDLVAEQPPRNIILFIDLFYSTPYGISRAIEVAEDFVIDRIQPGDRVMVLTYFRSLKVVQPFTSSKTQVVRALRESGLVSGQRTAQLEALSGKTETYMSDTNADVPVDEILGEAVQELQVRRQASQANAKNYLRSLDALSDVVKQVRGRKTLIMLSGGIDFNLIDPIAQNFAGTGPNTRRQQGQTNMSVSGGGSLNTLLPEYKQTMQELNNAQTSVYTINTSGLQALGSAEIQRTENDSSSGGPVIGSGREQIAVKQDFLSSIASETGGRAYFNRNDIRGMLDEVEVDISNYYIIGYRSNFDPTDPEYRKISVEVDLPGAKVLHRRGFTTPVSYAAMDEEERDFHLIKGLQNGIQINNLKAASEAQMVSVAGEDARIIISSRIPVESLKTNDDGAYDLQLLASNLDEENELKSSIHKRLLISGADAEKLTAAGVQLVETLNAHPGLNKIRIALRDNVTGLRSYFFYTTGLAERPDDALLLSPPVFYKKDAPQRISDIARVSSREEEKWNTGPSGSDLLIDPRNGPVFPDYTRVYTDGESVSFFSRISNSSGNEVASDSLGYILAAGRLPEDGSDPDYYQVKADRLEVVPYRSGVDAALSGEFTLTGWQPGTYSIVVIVQNSETGQQVRSSEEIVVRR